MRQVLVHNLSQPLVKPILAKYCDTFLCQLRGLTFRRELPLEEGLLLVQRRDSRWEAAIHMLGMSMDLTIVWINSRRRVVDVRFARRWRLIYLPCQPARYVLEIALARLDDFRIGDEVGFVNIKEPHGHSL